MLLVVFEELEKTSQGEWEKLSSNLKTAVTSDKITYEEKYMNPYQAQNISNYIVNTNKEALKDSHERRIYCADLSTKRKNDHEYFSELSTRCFNDKVGHAFYCLMKERDIQNFNPQKFPSTKAKQEAQSDRLSPLYQMLKFNYLLLGKDIDCTLKELFDEYLTYWKASEGKTREPTKNNMTSKLREVGIEFFPSHGTNKYRVPNDKLKEIATKFNWYSIHDADDMQDDQDDKLGDDLLDHKIKKQFLDMQRKLDEQEKLINSLRTKLERYEPIDNVVVKVTQPIIKKLFKKTTVQEVVPLPIIKKVLPQPIIKKIVKKVVKINKDVIVDPKVDDLTLSLYI